MSYISFIRLSDLLLGIGVAASTLFTLFLCTLPTRHDPYAKLNAAGPAPGETGEDEKFKNATRDRLQTKQPQSQKSIQIVVLGDIGRSPRMQYHAISFAKHGGKVDFIGYYESELHPDIKSNNLISVIPLVPTPDWLQTSNKLLFLLLAPLKVLWQVWTLYHTLGYRTKPAQYMLVQNPPSIPTLAIAWWMCYIRCTKLVIDWHNFGYTILALRLAPQHPLVRVSKWYEGFFAQHASVHFAVTNAMVRVLQQSFGVKAAALHDRPAAQFQPLTPEQRSAFLHRLPETAQHAKDIESGKWKLIVSATSWTADEDFLLFLEALQAYSSRKGVPKILAIITGKGPMKDFYLQTISSMNQSKKLENVLIKTAWLTTGDYASLLGAADLGVSLHTSSSGVDLPMKVVDMFGAGLPVVGWGKFEAWPELVKEGVNGKSFGSSDELADLLVELFGGGGNQLRRLRNGALDECKRRWDDEWDPVAGKVFRFSEELSM